MTNIKIIKKQDSFAYKYDIVNENNKVIYITKSGFKTPQAALEAAKKSYNTRCMNRPHQVEVIKRKRIKRKKTYRIKNLKVTDGGYKLIEFAAFGAIAITLICGCVKIISDLKSKFPDPSDIDTMADDYDTREVITASDCDFSNLHIIIRTAKDETLGVGAVTSDMLTKLGLSNEIVSKDSDISAKVTNAISNNPGSNIVVINIESGYENSKSNNTIIMGDSSNRRRYSSDILAACFHTSLKEYSLEPIVRSGVVADIWRNNTYLEKELSNATLIDNVSQITIDLPKTVGEDNITRNDAAASIVEGLMRWTTLDVTERYKNIYYTTLYSDTISSIASDHGVSIQDMDKISDVNMRKGLRVGNTVLIGVLPKVATNDVLVYNKFTTTDATLVEPQINTYIVQSGDTVTKIANMYGVKIEDIVVPSGNINNIQIGDTIYITTYNLYETHGKTRLTEEYAQKHI